ncbi:MAG: VOC family protein [Solirubrobacterales bacterium]
MRMNGVHNVTAITGDAQRNVDFYVGVLGLRLVKKTVNQDQTSVYHLFYADESASSGADMTFFEYRGAPLGRAGDGMVHRVAWRVGSPDAVDFWAQRLEGAGREIERSGTGLTFSDPEGLAHELISDAGDDPPLRGAHPEIPQEVALRGFEGVRAFSSAPDRSRDALETPLQFEPLGSEEWEVRGDTRGGTYAYDAPPAEPGLQGPGTVHHVAWSVHPEDQEAWRERISQGGMRPTPIIDRHYFESVYFREPSGVLFEIATPGPGFAVDEPPETLGQTLSLPPFLEAQRSAIEPGLTPLHDPLAAER